MRIISNNHNINIVKNPASQSQPSFQAQIRQGTYDICLPGKHGKAEGIIFILLDKYYPDSIKNLQVVDLGAGYGRNSVALAKKECSVTSVDLSGKQLEKLEKYSNLRNLGVKTLQGNLLSDLTQENILKGIFGIRTKGELLNPEQFDLAIMCNVSQHFNEQELALALANANKLLKKDGMMIFDALINNHEYVVKNPVQAEKGGYRSFNKEDVKSAINSAGFELVECKNHILLWDSSPYVKAKQWGYKTKSAKKDDMYDVTLKWFVIQKK